MAYAREQSMYPHVCEWLKAFLADRHAAGSVRVIVASRNSLSRLVQHTGLATSLPAEWPSWDIHVDVVGLVRAATSIETAFVECKNVPITLGHLSQLLGYSRVARPLYSFLISPQGMSGALRSLLQTYQRTDILEYHVVRGKVARSIVVGRWDEAARTLDWGSIVGADASYVGRL